jgi:hypothetical protein
MTLRNCPGGGTMVAKELDEEVWSRVLQVIAHPEILLKEIEVQLSQPDTAEKDLESLDRELAKIERQQKSTANAISLLDNEEAYAPLVEKLQLLASLERELEREREIVLCPRNDLPTLVGLMEKLERDFTAMEEAIANLSYQEKRAILNSLGVKVKLWQMKHSPRFQIEMDVDLHQFLLNPTREPEHREIEEGQWISHIRPAMMPEPHQPLIAGKAH